MYAKYVLCLFHQMMVVRANIMKTLETLCKLKNRFKGEGPFKLQLPCLSAQVTLCFTFQLIHYCLILQHLVSCKPFSGCQFALYGNLLREIWLPYIETSSLHEKAQLLSPFLITTNLSKSLNDNGASERGRSWLSLASVASVKRREQPVPISGEMPADSPNPSFPWQSSSSGLRNPCPLYSEGRTPLPDPIRTSLDNGVSSIAFMMSTESTVVVAIGSSLADRTSTVNGSRRLLDSRNFLKPCSGCTWKENKMHSV